MREAAGSRRWVVLALSVFDLPVDKKGDPDRGKEGFIKPEHARPADSEAVYSKRAGRGSAVRHSAAPGL